MAFGFATEILDLDLDWEQLAARNAFWAAGFQSAQGFPLLGESAQEHPRETHGPVGVFSLSGKPFLVGFKEKPKGERTTFFGSLFEDTHKCS